eukprot:522803_1
MSSHILFIIYIQLLCIINSHWSEIWYDSMDQNNGDWNTHEPGESIVVFGHVSENNNCKNCTRIKAVRIENNETCWIGRNTDIFAYSSIKLQFDLALSEMESDDRCRVSYAYDVEVNKQQIAEYNAPVDTQTTREAYHIPNQTITFPQSPSSQTLWIYFETDPGDIGGGDNCLVDNVFLYGILITNGPTSSPISPTNDPSISSTKHPSAPPSINVILNSFETSETLSKKDSVQETPDKNNPLLYGIIGLIIASIIALCLLVVCCWRYHSWCCCQNALDKVEENRQVPANTKLRVGIDGYTKVKEDAQNQKEKNVIVSAHNQGHKVVELQDDIIEGVVMGEADYEDSSSHGSMYNEGHKVNIVTRETSDGDNSDETHVMGANETAVDLLNDAEMNKQEELVHWLQSKGLEHCAMHFISNGYDGLDFLESVMTVQELIDIGIEDTEDQNKLMKFITLDLNTTMS